MLLEISGLVASVGGTKILDGIDLHVEEGETYMVFGPNGGGKTTLLMTILGAPGYKIESGSIRFNGKELKSLPTQKRVKLGLGIGFQSPPEVAGVALRDLLKVCAGKDADEDLNDYELSLVKKLKMEKYLDREVNRGFSGGERKRSEILQLLLMKPKLMLLDEPDSGVDVESLKLIGSTINDYIRDNNASALIVTHQGAVMDHIKASHACVLLTGKAYCYKGPKGILEDIRKHGYKGCVNCRLRRKDEDL